MPIRPESRETAVFAEVARHLKADGPLASVVRTWRTWDGSPKSDDPPSADQCPMVRLTPTARPIGLLASRGDGEHSATDEALGVVIETWVAGFDAREPMNLWGLVRRALLSRPADGGWLDPNFIYLREPAIPAGPESFDGTLWHSRGAFDVLYYNEG